MNHDIFLMFSLLIVVHYLCDYPLQGDFLAKAKNHRFPIPGVPWHQALTAHAAIHGGAVIFVTGIWWLGLLEAVTHATIDYLKCDDRIDFNLDQWLHLVSKGVWCAIAMWVLA